MTETLRAAYRWVTTRLKLCYLFVARILFAPNHFGVGLADRLKWAFCGGYMVDQVALYKLNEGTRDQYLSEFDWYRSRQINHPYEVVLNNKVVCAQMLAPHARVPEVLFFTQKGHIACPARPGRWASPEEVLDAIAVRGEVFIKPIASGKGKGVHLLGYGNGAAAAAGAAGIGSEAGVGAAAAAGGWTIDYAPVTRADVLEQLAGDDWHVVECVHQGAFLNGIFAQASNTVRAITVRDLQTGGYRMLFAVLRLGTSGTVPVDNGSKGGLIAKVDLATGELSEARSIQAEVCLERHPDTGAPIKGARIPGWAGVRDGVVSLAERFPFLEIVAWDILIADDGFWVIEANASTGVNIVQIWGGQRHGELGEFYRAHGIIK